MTLKIPVWNEYFFNLAQVVKTRSKDAETQVGCVLVDKRNRLLSTGYNSFPAGCKDNDLPNTRPDKYPYMVHAEINAILYTKADLHGATLYCTMSPCIDCSKAIITAGISRVLFIEKYSGFETVMGLYEVCGYRLETDGYCYILTNEESFHQNYTWSLM